MLLSVGAAVTAGQDSAWSSRSGGVPSGGGGPGPAFSQERISVASATFTLAALRDRADQAYHLARTERNESGGDPSHSDPDRLRKLYPPYPDSIRERVVHLGGLARVDAALMAQASMAPASDHQAQDMAERLSARLTQRPDATLSRRTAADLITNLESEA